MFLVLGLVLVPISDHVCLQDDKKRIKTESGVYISATYKTNRYSKWKERSKLGQQGEELGEQEEHRSHTGLGATFTSF